MSTQHDSAIPMPAWLFDRYIAVAGDLERMHGAGFAIAFLNDIGVDDTHALYLRVLEESRTRVVDGIRHRLGGNASQRRKVSDVQPILAAMDVMAAHCDSYSLPASWTMRTARFSTSGE